MLVLYKRVLSKIAITTCTFCGKIFSYEKGKVFMDCPECGLTNYREVK